MITLEHLSRTYTNGSQQVTVLKDVSLTIPKGEFIAIVGASGNGKSTLLNMITGIDRPSQGRILVDDTDLAQLNENKLAAWRGRHIGIVFQFFQMLPSLTLLQNVILPMEFAGRIPRAQWRSRAEALLDQVGLGLHHHKLPSEISGGQQQRAAIARALANDPPVIVADEPTGNLDTTTSTEILNLFQQLHAGGRTLILVTHSHSLAAQAERVLTIVDGQVASDVRRPDASPIRNRG